MLALQAGIFQLPGKKQLLDPDYGAKLIVIDATETPIERPKKRLSSVQKWKEEMAYSQVAISGRPRDLSCDLYFIRFR